MAHLDELRNAKKAIRPFDALLLRARAGGLVGGERLQQTSLETFPPGVLDGLDLASLVQPPEDLDRSTQPFAEERAAEPPAHGAIEGSTPTAPEGNTERGTTRRPASEVKVAPIPQAANRPMWMYLAPLAALAASALIAAGVALSGPPTNDSGIRLRGSGDLELRVLDGTTMRAYDGKPVPAGATVGFAVAPGAHHTVVIVSIDSTGLVSPWIPASGQGSVPVGAADAALVPLNGSVTLDATPGPEVFVALFDMQASDAMSAISAQFKSGGTAGVRAWADKAPDADAVVVEKR